MYTKVGAGFLFSCYQERGVSYTRVVLYWELYGIRLEIVNLKKYLLFLRTDLTDNELYVDALLLLNKE